MTSQLRPAPFGRLLTAMITPTDGAGGLDLSGAATLAAHLTSSGSDGLVVAGSTGMGALLEPAELQQLWETVTAQRLGVPVLAGIGGFGTASAVAAARTAAAAGVDALLVCTPAYTKPSQAGIVKHVRDVAAAAPHLPIMIYDVPSRTGMAMSTDTIVALAELEQVVALKDAKADLQATSEVTERAPHLAVYSGDDGLTLPLLAQGAVGVVSVASHVLGPQLRQMIRHVDAGQLEQARQIHLRCMPAIRALFVPGNPAGVTAACLMAGLPGGPLRGALDVPVSAEHSAVLHTALRNAGATLRHEALQVLDVPEPADA